MEALRISTASQAWRSIAFHRCAIREIRKGGERSIPSGHMPSRSFAPVRGPQYVIPLYIRNNDPWRGSPNE